MGVPSKLRGTTFACPGPTDIELQSGKYLNLASPDPSAITIEDVACGLGRVARFAGQARSFYSVAEHAVLVAEKLRSDGQSNRVVSGGLHHDDSEAFIHDVTSPLKRLVPQYKQIEETMSEAIAVALSLPALTVDEMKLVHDADMWALALEAFVLLPSQGRGWLSDGLIDDNDYERFGHLVVGLSPENARQYWLDAAT